MARFSSGPEGGYAVSSPAFETIVYPYTFSAATMNSNVPQPIKRVNGQHRIIMRYTNGGILYSWSFGISGGTNRITSEWAKPRGVASNNNFITSFGDPPRGCTVVVVLPQPTNTTLVNVFQVTETVTGLGLIFVFAYCPTMGISSTVVYPSGQAPLTSNVIVDLLSYRLPDTFRTPAMYISFQAPEYYVHPYITNFTSSGGVNPLDDNLPHPFSNISGQQTIVVSIGNFYFSFEIDAKIAACNGYIGYVNNTMLNSEWDYTAENATIDSIIYLGNPLSIVNPVQYTLTSIAPDSNTYIFVIYPDSRPPTIQLQAPGVQGANNVTVTVNKNVYDVI
jgi:hypothetical protein